MNQNDNPSEAASPQVGWARIFSPGCHRGLGLVLLLSGVLGFLIGCFAQPDWQVAVETAQVVAGLVQYPTDNPFYMYHVKLWTILHQILAVLLKLGLSEKTLSLLVSGLLGMVTFQAFATIILALSEDWRLALGGAVAIYFSRPNEFGVNYPIWFMGAEHTYGILGLSYMLLVGALLGGGWRRIGALLLGLAPAVHPSLGFWLGIAVGICCLWDIRQFRQNWLPGLKYFLLGGAITTISLLIQLMVTYDLPKGPPIDTTQHFYSFVSFWDMHRAPVYPKHPGVFFNWWMAGVCAVWLIFFKKDIPPGSILLLRFILVMAALGLAAMVLSWVPVEKVPRTLVMLMPARLLNFAILSSVAMLIGILGFYRAKIWGQILLFVLVAGLVVGGAMEDGMILFFSSNFWRLVVTPESNPETLNKLMLNPWKWMPIIVVITITAVVLSRWRTRLANRTSSKKGKKSPVKAAAPEGSNHLALTWTRRANWFLFSGIFVLTLILAYKMAQNPARDFQDRTNNPVLAEVAKGEGILLTGGDLHLVQLKTRRPILLDGGGLDGVAYIPQAAPAMERILRDVYKINFFTPPDEARGQGAVPRWENKSLWETMTPEEWKELGARYGFTDILTYGDWTLRLPRAAQDEHHILYRVPK